jgi:hypothetical protein
LSFDLKRGLNFRPTWLSGANLIRDPARITSNARRIELNVSAQDFFTRANLHSHGGRPNILRARFQIPGTWEKQQYDIYIRDKEDSPLWLIHPSIKIPLQMVTSATVGLRQDQEKGAAISLLPALPATAIAIVASKIEFVTAGDAHGAERRANQPLGWVGATVN